MKAIVPNPVNPDERVSTRRRSPPRRRARARPERGDWLDDEMTNALHQPYSAFHRFWFWAKKRIGRLTQRSTACATANRGAHALQRLFEHAARAGEVQSQEPRRAEQRAVVQPDASVLEKPQRIVHAQAAGIDPGEIGGFHVPGLQARYRRDGLLRQIPIPAQVVEQGELPVASAGIGGQSRRIPQSAHVVHDARHDPLHARAQLGVGRDRECAAQRRQVEGLARRHQRDRACRDLLAQTRQRNVLLVGVQHQAAVDLVRAHDEVVAQRELRELRPARPASTRGRSGCGGCTAAAGGCVARLRAPAPAGPTPSAARSLLRRKVAIRAREVRALHCGCRFAAPTGTADRSARWSGHRRPLRRTRASPR